MEPVTLRGERQDRENRLANMNLAKKLEELEKQISAHAVGVQNVYNRILVLEQMVKNRLRID